MSNREIKNDDIPCTKDGENEEKNDFSSSEKEGTKLTDLPNKIIEENKKQDKNIDGQKMEMNYLEESMDTIGFEGKHLMKSNDNFLINSNEIKSCPNLENINEEHVGGSDNKVAKDNVEGYAKVDIKEKVDVKQSNLVSKENERSQAQLKDGKCSYSSSELNSSDKNANMLGESCSEESRHSKADKIEKPFESPNVCLPDQKKMGELRADCEYSGKSEVTIASKLEADKVGNHECIPSKDSEKQTTFNGNLFESQTKENKKLEKRNQSGMVDGGKQSAHKAKNNCTAPDLSLRFHIIIPSEKLRGKEKIKLTFMGKFTIAASGEVMLFDRSLVNGIDIYYREVKFARDHLAGVTISYKYTFSTIEIKKQVDIDFLKYYQNVYEFNIYDAYHSEKPSKGILHESLKALKSFIITQKSDLSNIGWCLELFPKKIQNANGKDTILEFVCVYKSALRHFKEHNIEKDILDEVTLNALETFLKNSSEEESLSAAACLLVIIMDLKLTHKYERFPCLCTSLAIRPDKTNECANYNHFCKLFPEDHWKRNITDALMDFFNKIVTEKQINPDWVLALPFLHFLEGESKPFTELEICEKHQSEKWWGISKVAKQVKICKRMVLSDILLDLYMESLSPMFEVDHLLPRSLLAMMSIEHIPYLINTKKFPLDACLNNAYYFIETAQYHYSDYKKWDYIMMNLHRAIYDNSDELVSNLKSEESRKEGNKFHYISKLTFGLFALAMQNLSLSDENKVLVIKIMVKVLHGPHHVVERLPETEDFLHNTFLEARNKISYWINSLPHENRFSVCSDLLEISTDSNSLFRNWIDSIKAIFMNNFTKLNFTRKCSMHSKLVNSYHPMIQNCIMEDLIKEVENGLKRQTGELNIIFEHDDNQNFQRIFDKIISNIWPDKDNDHGLMNFVLTHPLLPKLAKLYQLKNLGDESKVKLVQVLSLLETLEKSLTSGDITVESANALCNNEESYLAAMKAFFTEDEDKWITTENSVKKLLKRARDNILFYKRKCNQIRILLDFCNNNAELQAYKEEISKNFDELLLLAISRQPIAYGDGPVLAVVQLDSVAEEMLTFLEENQESHILRRFWMDYHQKINLQSKSVMNDISQSIYKPCWLKWNYTSKSLRDGSILLSDVSKIFGNSTDTINELNLLCKFSPQEVKKINDALENLKKLQDCKKGAKVMLEFKQMFGLTGYFDDAEKIADSVKMSGMKLSEITEKLVKDCCGLLTFTDIKRKCLEVFIEEKKFVDWMRQTLSGPREIKVLVDLALTSAEGQGDIEVEKVSCLHAAATAYSSLIYDLKPEMGFIEFIQLCQPVWNVASVDARISNKFKDAARHLEWFKEIKESHGAVEVNALQSAAQINSKGIFTIGSFSIKESGVLTLEDVVELRLHLKKGDKDIDEVTENLDAEKWKVYDIKKLFDLQSKLMLVAGKAQEGRKDIEGFNRTFDAILRLAGLYIKLVDRGCCMFTTWKVTFFCNSTKSIYARIDFSSDDENSEYIYGKQSKEPYLKIHERIEMFCNALENCLNDWNNYIKSKRLEKHYINFFTTKQLVVLQREIASVLNGKSSLDLGIDLSLLLSQVCPSCSKEKLLSVASCTLEETPIKKDEVNNIENSSDPILKETLSEFIKTLQDLGYPLLLAKAAEANCNDIKEGIIWCMENEENFEREEILNLDTEIELKIFQPNKIIFKDFLQIETKNLAKNLIPNESHLEKQFLEIWNVFLEKVDVGFADYISIKHLGLILESLGFEGNSMKKSRSLPFNMEKGSPNLIMVDQDEVWITILSIYALSPKEPLPALDEVLVCKENTSAEEIEIMCLRAREGRSGKIYCLVNADLLNYNVAICVENYLNFINEETNFVIVCNSNRHSHIANAFDQFKVKFLPFTYQDIQEYLQEHLKQQSPISCNEMDGVRLILSNQAGAGKTLKIKRAIEYYLERNCLMPPLLTIPLQNKDVDVSSIVKSLREFAVQNKNSLARFIHFDITSEVTEGVDCLLFSLLILGGLSDEDGYVWKKMSGDVYLIESCPLTRRNNGKSNNSSRELQNDYLHRMFHLLPSLTCWSPMDSFHIMENKIDEHQLQSPLALDQLLDEKEFESEQFKRVYGYLSSKQTRQEHVDMSMKNCISILTRFCGVENPSWAELKHFIDFFNNQLIAYERSVFCQQYMNQDLPGFRNFVINFMLLMSQDFATRSLKISEESPDKMNDISEILNENLLEGYEMKRTWETSCHPYLFFNDDGHSFTFVGFVVDRVSGNIINPENSQVLMQSAVGAPLFDALQRNGVNLSENFNALQRVDKLKKMATVMGLDIVHDPDEHYELTADNVKKMLAIYMRFRCNIPVVIMGETGCGKTSLIKYLCNFMKPPFSEVKNMFLMKIHGGTTIRNVVEKIKRVSLLAKQNSEKIPGLQTVLFFDEANTTGAIGVIKEAMCDHSICGESFDAASLKLIAACNPYRKHSDDFITKLEKAGLGYHVSANKTNDRLGVIPMRQLVYRVRSLPPSMFPLVWDFGNLNEEAERLYIKQMVQHCLHQDLGIDTNSALISSISEILSASQNFMRQQNDECSFVSLRDVDRCLKVMAWFYNQDSIFDKMDEFRSKRQNIQNDVIDDDDGDDDDVDDSKDEMLDELSRSLILALGVCYHACLSKREEYRVFISPYFASLCKLHDGPNTLLEEISVCQDVFVNEVSLNKNIARNQALKENLFVMVICIELRIPLFLIGKPGSSKSLAKTVVGDAMQGNQSKSKLFRNFKSAHMVSYQCSPLSTPEGITGIFKQCAKLQESKDLEKYVSVVVLDEVGLAEDSEKMPLKALHPLLEDGCEDEDDIQPHKKVAFIGISNWSLDPAKMNRGIFVQRSSPDEGELILSASGICSSDEITSVFCEKLFRPLAKGYLKLCETTMEIREFFGLRDFYSLIKMTYAMSKKLNKTPSWIDLQRAILRNFSGLDKTKAIEIFKEFVKIVIDTNEDVSSDESLVAVSLIHESLTERNLDYDNRYLLILMDNYSSFNLLQHDLLQMDDAIIIFGSSFPKDQEYTQICRNINRIKICMETGKTVILLNLENLYESLYDALNQYYVMLGDQRFVDLGLGTQRVKCKVHKSFRLIVVAEKKVVLRRFPIPLINRLEKHCLSIESLLTLEQMDIEKDLQIWANNFLLEGHFPWKRSRSTLADVFIGFHPNALASLVLQAHSNLRNEKIFKEEILKWCQDLLLHCAVPESVVRLGNTKELFGKDIYKTYFEKQQHDSLCTFIKSYVLERTSPENIFAQVTTHSRLLSKLEVDQMVKILELPSDSIELLSLQVFDTEQQFCGSLKDFFESSSQHDKILLIQCDSGDQHKDLIACTRFIILNEYSNWKATSPDHCLKHILFIIQLPKVRGGCFVGFQGGKWLSYHIDNLQPDSLLTLFLPQMRDKTISSLLDMDCEKSQREQEVLNKIVENCIHAAASLLKNPFNWHGGIESRKTERLKPLMQNLLARNDLGVTFLDLLRKRVSLLLHEREERVTIHPDLWLSREAASLESVCNAGSFGNSVAQCLEAKVTPILAYIISYIDSNCNLDLLSSPNEWIVRLWLGMFTNENITSMKYSDIHALSLTQEVHQFGKRTYGQGRSEIRGQLPFSWLIKDRIDKLISNFHLRPEWMNGTTFDVEKTFDSSDIGELLKMFSRDFELKKLMFDMYLKDYIQMTYRPSSHNSDKEFDLVAKDIRQRIFADELDKDVLNFCNIHKVYTEHSLKYKLFSEFIACCPESINYLHDQIENNSIEMTLLQQCLTCILEILEFSKEKSTKSLKPWVDKVKSMTSIVNQLFHQSKTDEITMDFNSLMCSWNRICALRMFVEFMSSDDLLDQDVYIKLWAFLGEKFDLKTSESYMNIEKFLNICNTKGIRKCFGNVLMTKCCSCKEEDGVIRLLCDHNYCQECFDEIETFHHNKCTLCGRPAEKENQNVTEESQGKYASFKRKLNYFFMTLVSKMCFDGQEPPDQEIIEKLLKFVVFKSDEDLKTRNLLLRRNDSSPVVRSFLLQLLLKHRMTSVESYLEKFLSDSMLLLHSDNDQLVELGILCLNCFEDHYQNLGMKKIHLTEKLEFVRDLWKKNDLSSLINANGSLEIITLKRIAILRYGLSVLAEGLNSHYIVKSLDECGYRAMRSLSDLANAIFINNDQARLFLLKQIAHKFDFQSLLRFSEQPSCKWFITPSQVKRDIKEKSLDHFLLIGDSYKITRDAVVQAFYRKMPSVLDKDKHSDYNLVLALFQQAFKEFPNDFSADDDFDIWHKYISSRVDLKSQDIGIAILKNELKFLTFKQNLSQKDRDLLCLTFHFFVSTSFQCHPNDIIKLLCVPIDRPEYLKDAYLPTMPQDDEFEVLQLLGRAGPIALYKCPNGHSYSIGECGKPAVLSRCPTCGSEIGGLNHNPAHGNITFQLINEKTLPGHILGQPVKSRMLTGDRKMSPLQLSITRFLFHISMYIGSFQFDFSQNVIKPQISSKGVQEFIWSHMENDFEMIKVASGKNHDDITILLHLIIKGIQEKVPFKPNMKLDLSSKEGRTHWENEFVEEYIRPHFDNVNEVIEKGRELILGDDELALGPLRKYVYEVSTGGDNQVNLQDLQRCHVFWKYRDRISRENLLLNLQNMKEASRSGTLQKSNHLVLQHFLENSYILQEIRRLPRILDLQKKLYASLNRRIGIAEAEEFSVSRFLKEEDDITRADLEELFQEFISSWNTLHYNLLKFVFLKMKLPKKYVEEHLSFDSKIGFFLPSLHGCGICAVALVHFLVEQQNTLLDVYEQFIGKSISKYISLEECSSVHLVLFDHEKDLHTLILANCRYSLEVGKYTRLEYDYINLEKQLVDRFICDKPRIKPNVKYVSYKEDFDTFAVFSELEHRIPQDSVLPELLENDFKILPDVSKALVHFNVVLEYISSVGHDANENIIEFMQETLKMRNVFDSYRSMANLQFKHSKQAWITLSFIQAKLQVKNGQLPFRAVDAKYKQLMPPEIQQKLVNCFQYMIVDLFSSLLYECIILKVTTSMEAEEEIDNSNQSLVEILLEFVSSKNLEGTFKALENGIFPKEILAKHCIDAWLCTVDSEKRVLLE